MSLGLAFGLLLAAVVLVPGIVALVIAWRNAQIDWKVLRGPFSALFVAPEGFDQRKIIEALSTSIVYLANDTRWTVEQLNGLTDLLRIIVVDRAHWVDEWNRDIKGAQVGGTIFVNETLDTFLHEFAHFCEEELDREVNVTHRAWLEKGIITAEQSFAQWHYIWSGGALGKS